MEEYIYCSMIYITNIHYSLLDCEQQHESDRETDYQLPILSQSVIYGNRWSSITISTSVKGLILQHISINGTILPFKLKNGPILPFTLNIAPVLPFIRHSMVQYYHYVNQ